MEHISQLVELACHVDGLDVHVIVCHAAQNCFVFFVELIDEDMNIILTVGRCVVDERPHGDGQVRGIMIVHREKDGDDWLGMVHGMVPFLVEGARLRL